MIDLKILAIRDLLTILSVEYANVSPPSLLIRGEKFNDATKVIINDVDAPEFLVISNTSLVAQLPTSERTSAIRKIAVLAEKPSTSRSSLLRFEVGPSMKGLSGLERLVQYFCKLLLQTPGTDRFRPNDGGGLLSIIGLNMSRNDSKSLQASIVGAVNRTRDQILSYQSQNSRIPADERLLSAATDTVGYDPSTTTVSARVLLSAVSGRQAVANLTF